MPMISLQVDNNFVTELDSIQKQRGYTSRSETLRVCISDFIGKHQKTVPEEGHRIASIIVHHNIREDVYERFQTIANQYESIVKSINQYNLKKKVIKSIIVAGSGIEINDLYQAFSSDRLFQTTITYLVITNEEVDKKK